MIKSVALCIFLTALPHDLCSQESQSKPSNLRATSPAEIACAKFLSNGNLLTARATGGDLQLEITAHSKALAILHFLFKLHGVDMPEFKSRAKIPSSYLDSAVNMRYTKSLSPKVYTTRQVAERAGISRQTLQTWIAENKVKAPRVIAAAGVRLWTEADLAQVLKVKPRDYPRKVKGKKRS